MKIKLYRRPHTFMRHAADCRCPLCGILRGPMCGALLPVIALPPSERIRGDRICTRHKGHAGEHQSAGVAKWPAEESAA